MFIVKENTSATQKVSDLQLIGGFPLTYNDYITKRYLNCVRKRIVSIPLVDESRGKKDEEELAVMAVTRQRLVLYRLAYKDGHADLRVFNVSQLYRLVCCRTGQS